MPANILFIMTDQQRWDATGNAGNWVETPNIDRIAAQGIVFDNAVTGSPECVPARLSLATGLYPHHTRVWKNRVSTLNPQLGNWMRILRDGGYRTSLFGKSHLHPHQGGVDLRERLPLMHEYGLDDVDEVAGPHACGRVTSNMTERWRKLGLLQLYRKDLKDRLVNHLGLVVRPSVLPLAEYPDVYVGSRAANYLENYRHQQPWFCWVSFNGPHSPWDTPEPYASRYHPDDMPPPAPIPRSVAGRPRGILDSRIDGEKKICRDPKMPPLLRANYAANVSLIDDQIGKLIAVLEARGELDNTWIFFTSDHGEMNGDANLIYKGNFLDGAVRIPMIARPPAIAGERHPAPGIRSSQPVELNDIGPSIVAAAGRELDYRQFGKSFLPCLDVPGYRHREAAISEFRREVMMLTPEWKIAINADKEVYLMFDRVDDPGETRNLASDARFACQQANLKSMLEQELAARDGSPLD